jgi:hypothetical protein
MSEKSQWDNLLVETKSVSFRSDSVASTYWDSKEEAKDIRQNNLFESSFNSACDSKDEEALSTRNQFDKNYAREAECEEIDLEEAVRNFAKKGQPSIRWKDPSVFNRLTDWVTCDKPNRPIICEYDPKASWLWTRWQGTALSLTFIPVIVTMTLGILVDLCVRFYFLSGSSSRSFLAIPSQDNPVIRELAGLKSLWEYQLTLCTLVLSFFTSQAYSFWRSVYFTTRSIQGRINDICMLTTVTAAQGEKVNYNEKFTGYSNDASDLVQTCTRLVRLSHTFFWASTPTCSNGIGDDVLKVADEKDDDESLCSSALRFHNYSPAEIGPILLSLDGLKLLEEAEELTSNEVNALLTMGIPPSQYTYVLLGWVGSYISEGLANCTLRGGPGMEENLYRQLALLRAEYFGIGDQLSGALSYYLNYHIIYMLFLALSLVYDCYIFYQQRFFHAY